MRGYEKDKKKKEERRALSANTCCEKKVYCRGLANITTSPIHAG